MHRTHCSTRATRRASGRCRKGVRPSTHWKPGERRRAATVSEPRAPHGARVPSRTRLYLHDPTDDATMNATDGRKTTGNHASKSRFKLETRRRRASSVCPPRRPRTPCVCTERTDTSARGRQARLGTDKRRNLNGGESRFKFFSKLLPSLARNAVAVTAIKSELIVYTTDGTQRWRATTERRNDGTTWDCPSS